MSLKSACPPLFLSPSLSLSSFRTHATVCWEDDSSSSSPSPLPRPPPQSATFTAVATALAPRAQSDRYKQGFFYGWYKHESAMKMCIRANVPERYKYCYYYYTATSVQVEILLLMPSASPAVVPAARRGDKNSIVMLCLLLWLLLSLWLLLLLYSFVCRRQSVRRIKSKKNLKLFFRVYKVLKMMMTSYYIQLSSQS